MVGYLLLYLISGALIANGVPHFVKGVSGESHRSPFGSSAVTNVLWGSLSLAVGWGIWHSIGLSRSLDHTLRYELAFGVGLVAMAVFLASYFSGSKK